MRWTALASLYRVNNPKAEFSAPATQSPHEEGFLIYTACSKYQPFDNFVQANILNHLTNEYVLLY